MSGIGHNTAAGKQLRAFVERIEYVNEEIAKTVAARGDIFREARSLGFCPKAMKAIIKLRAMDKDARDEHEALVDIYKSALGMLEGTPLGEAARARLAAQPPPKENTQEKPASGAKGYPVHGAPKPESKPETGPDRIDPETGEILPPEDADPKETKETLEDARENGRVSARAGKTVINNPYPAGDAKRAAWDEGWCEEQGSDGMGIPAAWQRRKPKPHEGPRPDGANGEARP